MALHCISIYKIAEPFRGLLLKTAIISHGKDTFYFAVTFIFLVSPEKLQANKQRNIFNINFWWRIYVYKGALEQGSQKYYGGHLQKKAPGTIDIASIT